MKTTLNKIKIFSPCKIFWGELLNGLGKTKADDEELELLTILDISGLLDTLWCFRAVDGYDKEKRLFAIWCARQVQHLVKDERLLKALDVAEDYANGKATDEELAMARKDAAAAYYDAYYDNTAYDTYAAYAACAFAAVCANAIAAAYAAVADDDAREAQKKELKRILIETDEAEK